MPHTNLILLRLKALGVLHSVLVVTHRSAVETFFLSLSDLPFREADPSNYTNFRLASKRGIVLIGCF